MVEVLLAFILSTNGGRMADFNKAYQPTVMIWEKWGLENVPGDYGGLTFAGISKTYHPEITDLWDNIEAAEKARTAVERFYRKLWETINGDRIQSNDVAAQIFQGYVHCWDRSAKWAQEICNEKGNAGLVIDGIIGDKSVIAINRIPPAVFKEAYFRKQMDFYRSRRVRATIAKQNLEQKRYSTDAEKKALEQEVSQLKFIQGWENRAIYFAR
jgi:lysozyme family protein